MKKILLLLLLMPMITSAQVRVKLENWSGHYVKINFLGHGRSFVMEPMTTLNYLVVDTLSDKESVVIVWADSKQGLKDTTARSVAQLYTDKTIHTTGVWRMSFTMTGGSGDLWSIQLKRDEP